MSIFLEESALDIYKTNPLILVDIGAADGVELNWKKAQKYLEIIGFEPDDRAFGDLEKNSPPGNKYFKTGLYSSKMSLRLNLTRKQNTSSCYLPNINFLKDFPDAERYDVVGTVEFNTDTLDSQFSIHNQTDADFIKVDVQGSELEILKGSTSTLQKCIFGLEVEVEFCQIYKDQPVFADVDTFLRSQGYQLFDLKRYFWKRSKGKALGNTKGQIIFADSLYLKTIPNFKIQLDNLTNNELKQAKILKAISICILYGYADYAFDLLDATSESFEKSRFESVKSELVKKSKKRILPNFPGRGVLASCVRYLWSKIKVTHHGWGESDNDLGNL